MTRPVSREIGGALFAWRVGSSSMPGTPTPERSLQGTPKSTLGRRRVEWLFRTAQKSALLTRTQNCPRAP